MKALGRAARAVFTLRGLLTVFLVGALAGSMLFVMTQRMQEVKYVAPPQGGDQPSAEATGTPRIAIVIVGLGGESKGLDVLIARLLGLDVPMTYGVMPRMAGTRRHAQLAGAPPSEVDLHLPIAYSKGPGIDLPGTVDYQMRRRQLAREVVRDIYSVGNVSGIIAKGGYAPRRTDSDMLRIIMTMAKRRNLHFLDVEGNTRARAIARQLDVEYLKPDIVLDDVATADNVRSQISVAINKAVASKGSVIVLGHLLPVTVNTLQDLIGKIKDAKVELSTLTGLASTEATGIPSLAPTTTPEVSPTVPSTSTVPQTTTPSAPGSQFQF